MAKGLVNLVGGSEVGHRRSKKGKGKKKRKKKVVGATSGQTICKRNKSGVSHGECFFCKKQGHWKRNCPLYIASLDPNRPKKKKKQQVVAATGIYMINPCNFTQCDIYF